MVSRHSAFYSPLIATLARGFPASYAILGPGQKSYELIRDGVVDIMQSAVSSNWRPMDRGESPLPVHFALINRRDGFFLEARRRGAAFAWKELEGKTLLADHGLQPLTMLRYAVHCNGADWSKINVLDRGTPEEMKDAFRRGEGDYVHLQAPGPEMPVVAVGASMPEVAFSTLCCSEAFIKTKAFADFLTDYKATRQWVRSAPPAEVAELEQSYFRGVSRTVLADAVARYQQLGTWAGDTEIAEELYKQAQEVFAHSGSLAVRYPRSAVCG